MRDADHPDLLVFPPLAVAVAVAAAVVLEWLVPLHLMPPVLTFSSTLLGLILIAASVALVAGGARTIARAGSNFDPRQPTIKLVDAGIYRFSRNPMYLGMVVLQFGLAFLFSLDWAILGGVALGAVLHYGVVMREETYLAAKFGSTYTDFTTRTRRWL